MTKKGSGCTELLPLRSAMFEIEDSKFGKIKVVNITEARASMASIMTDKTYNYVITKNNRPIRIIVNFETYKKLQGGSTSRSVKSQEQKESKDLIKGLIQTRDKEMKLQGSSAMGGLLESTAPVEPKKDKKEELEREKPAEQVKGENDDYFNRFKKLYQTPRHEPLFKDAAKKSEVVAVRNDLSVEEEGAKEELPEPPEDISGNEISEAYEPVSHQPSRHENLPSIQDLLNELEDEKLSGEEEELLRSEDVKKLINGS